MIGRVEVAKEGEGGRIYIFWIFTYSGYGRKGQNLHILDMVPTLPKIFTYFQLNTNNFHYPKVVENTNPYDSTVD